MSFSTTWDVNKYYDKTEYHEHWNLRKEFMITHMNKYPEERLVGLAKIFYNMEFLGCVYKTEVMLLVKNLCLQVDAIVQYRERKKCKLQRTFVKASDAVKRHSKPDVNTSKPKYVNFVPAKDDNTPETNKEKPEEPVTKTDQPFIQAAQQYLQPDKFIPETNSKKRKIDFQITNEFQPEFSHHVQKIIKPAQPVTLTNQPFIQAGQQYLKPDQFMPIGHKFQKPKPYVEQMSKTQQKKQILQQRKEQLANKYKMKFTIKPEDRQFLNKVKNQKGILGKLILYDTPFHISPFGCLDYSVKKLNIDLKMELDLSGKTYTLLLDGEQICESPNTQLSVSTKPKGFRKFKVPDLIKNELSTNALKHLKKYCFTIVDHNTSCEETISTDNLNFNKSKSEPKIELSMDGIGGKMMKQMGWGGQGLGKDATGIVEPIKAEIRVHRRGFGQPNDNVAFTRAVKDYFEKYLVSGETKRLVFSNDFSKDDRARLHSITGQYNMLKSRSYGKGDNRYLTVQRKLNGWELIEQLLANNGSNDCYSLIKPTAL